MRIFLAAVVAVIAVGCGGPPSAREVANTAADTAVVIVKEGAGSGDLLAQLSSLTVLKQGAQALGAPMDFGLASNLLTQSDPDANAERIERYLRERIFTEANVESTQGDTTIFRITGEDACSDGSAPPAPECIQSFDRFEVRFAANKPNGELRIALLLGPARHQPSAVRFAQDSLTLEANLDEAKKSYEYIAGVTQTPLTGVPEVFSGALEVQLRRNGEKDFTLSTSVVRAVRVEVTTSGGPKIRYSTAARSPLALVRVEVAHKRVTVELDMGPTDVFVDGMPMGTSQTPRNVAAHLSGASFSFFAQEGVPEFTIANVGLGDAQSYISLDGTKILTADLNAIAGRRFDVSVVPDWDAMPIFQVTPGLDLSVGTFLAPMEQDGAYLEPFLVNETHRFTLTPGARIKPVASTYTFSGGLKVLTGSLTLRSSNPSASVLMVPAGKCLGSSAWYDSPTLSGRLAVLDCP